MFIPREAQQRVLAYTGGKMGVSAVPGAGKTQTLSYLAAKIINNGGLSRGQQLLIVTLVNSAVNNFKQRIEEFTRERGLMPNMGYRVRTLHGLANDIVRERPDLAGLSEEFAILDEPESEEILRGSALRWMNGHPGFIYEWTNETCDLQTNSKVRNTDWPELIVDTARAFIRQAKDLQVEPGAIQPRLHRLRTPQPLLAMCNDIYHSYQQALRYQSAVDFDDLIRMALQALQSDPEFLAQLRNRWPYILEDEAQDSSRLQEEILRLLAGESGNWVRVGDPNQAIYETFTTANPRYLINFLAEPGVQQRELPNSGRSTRTIIRLANRLSHWVRLEHPVLALREALVPPDIREADAPGDPQPNPPDRPDRVSILMKSFTPEDELRKIAKSLAEWLPQNRESTVAVLVPSNPRGKNVVDELRKNGLEVVELLRISAQTRETVSTLAAILRCLAFPWNSQHLSKAYLRACSREMAQPEKAEIIKRAANLLSKLRRTEDFTSPLTGEDWLETLPGLDLTPELRPRLENFREVLARWQAASLLPPDQLILLIAQDLFTEPAELALAHKIALFIENLAGENPAHNLNEFATELEYIAQNQRRMRGFSEDDYGFDPEKHRGKVVVATVHKAKGLEWDRVYLSSVNNYDFPSCQPGDSYISERWFVRNRQNLQAEALAGLMALMQNDVSALYMDEGTATQESRNAYSAERLRLLYVGITRAKKELVITWNTGKNEKNKCTEALPLSALYAYLEEEKNHAHPA